MGVGVDDTRMRVLVPYALVGVAMAVHQIGPTQLLGHDRIRRTCQGNAGPVPTHLVPLAAEHTGQAWSRSGLSRLLA